MEIEKVRFCRTFSCFLLATFHFLLKKFAALHFFLYLCGVICITMKKSLLLALLLGAVSLSAQTYMSDGAIIQVGDTYMQDNIVRPGDIPELKQGTLSYDPVNHVLTMTNTYILVPSDASFVSGFAIGCGTMQEGSRQIEIRLVGQNIVEAQKTGVWGSVLLGDGNFVITGMNGSLKIASDNGIAFWLMCESLTIKDGALVYAGYPVDYKNASVGTTTLSDPTPVMTIDCATFYSYGTTCSMAGINPGLVNAEETNGYVYNSSDMQWKESDGVTTLKNKILEFAPTKHVFQWVNANPEGGTITVTKDGKPISNPYYYDKDEESTFVNVVATPNEGWEFVKWKTVSGYVESGTPKDRYALPELTQTGLLIGYFRQKQHAAPSKTWYLLSEYYDKIVSFDDWNSSPTVVSESFLSDMQAKKLKFATYANGRIYFLDQEETDASGFHSVEFNPATGTVSDPQTHVKAQKVCKKFDCLTYDMTDDFFYAVTETGDNSQYLVKINRKTDEISSVDEIENTDISNSIGIYLLAANPEGELYGIFKCGEQFGAENSPYGHGSMLCKIDKVKATATPIGWTGQYFESPSCSMAFDYQTGDLIATSYSNGLSCIFSIDVKTGRATPLQEYTSYCNGIFQLLPKMLTLTVGVMSGQEKMGKAVILETGKTVGFYPEGTEVDIEAFKSSSEYRFAQWSDGNKENPRTITLTESMTYAASFEEDPDFIKYDVFIGEEQFNMEKLTMTKENNSAIKNDGSVTFDPATNTLSLNAVEIESTVGGIRIGYDEDIDVTIVVNGTCYVKSNPSYCGLILYGKTLSTIKGGADNPKLTFDNKIAIFTCNFEISGLTAIVKGSNISIEGNQDNKLIVRGANLTAKAASTATISNWAAVEYKYCSVSPADILDTEGNILLYDDRVCDDSNNPWTGDIVFTPLPKLSVKPVQEGTAHFKLKAGDEEFTDEGFFAKDTKVTITPQPASDFVFGHWTDDANWKDKDNKLPAKRELEMPASDKELEALFYFEPESDANWFGINGDRFVKFGFSDHAEKAARATNSLTNVKAGEWLDGTWVFIEDEDVKKIPFSGSLKDGEDVKGDIKAYNEKTLSGVTDMAYDIINDELYAVAGSKLYKITTKENKEIATFKFEDVETAIVAIAFDADSKLYALGVGDGSEGVLYTASVSKEVATLKIVGKKENGGKIGMKVNNKPQSLAFDLQTNELFWGAPDYLRIIDTQKMKTFIVGDLGQKNGAQGYIQSLHRMIELVEVTVQVAEDQEDWGIVYLNDEPSTVKKPEVSASFIEGESVTIKAEANEGYHFVEWVYLDGKKEKTFKGNDVETYEFDADDITYIAYFEPDDEGIEEILKSADSQVSKYLIDGTLYIIKGGKVYNALGICVE